MPIGFWHTILKNQKSFFDFNKPFRFKIESDDAFSFFNYSVNNIDIGVIHKASLSLNGEALEDFKEISVNASDYNNFVQILTQQQKIKNKSKKQQIIAIKYVIAWLVVGVIIGFKYFNDKVISDHQKNVNQTLMLEKETASRKFNNIENSIIKTESSALKHINNMLKFNNSNIDMQGEFNLLNNEESFSFVSKANISRIKHAASKEDIKIKLDYDVLTKTSNVSWDVD